MNITNNTALSLLLAFSLGSTCVIAYAEGTVNSPNETIMHIEKAKVEIIHRDFMPPSEHLKAARAASEKVTGNPDIVKKANASIIQAQIKANQFDIKGATDEMNKTLELYKSLKSE
jgi:hypothetical protein